MVFESISRLGRTGVRSLQAIGRAGIMLYHALVGRPQFAKHFPLLVRQR